VRCDASARESDLAQRVLGAAPDPHLCLKLHEANYALCCDGQRSCVSKCTIFGANSTCWRHSWQRRASWPAMSV